MKGLKLSPRDQLIVGIAVIVLVAVLFSIFLVYPQIQKRQELKVRQAEVQKQVLSAEATLARLKEAKAQSVVNRAELMRIANQVPDDPEMPTLIVQVQDIANQAGVEFVSITPAEPKVEGSVKTIELGIALTGEFRDCVDFMTRLWALTREVRVTNMSMLSQSYPILAVELKAKAFVMAPPAADQAQAGQQPSGGNQ